MINVGNLDNTGTLLAESGAQFLSLGSVDNAVSGVINNDGIVIRREASFELQGGRLITGSDILNTAIFSVFTDEVVTAAALFPDEDVSHSLKSSPLSDQP